MLNLDDIVEGRALLARAKSGEPGAREALGAWFEAWGGLVLDMFERIHAPLPDPKRRFCSECGNRSAWPHTSWCSNKAESPPVATPVLTTWEHLRGTKRLLTEAIQMLESRPGRDDEPRGDAHPNEVAEIQLDLAHAAIEAAMASEKPVYDEQPDGHTRVRVR